MAIEDTFMAVKFIKVTVHKYLQLLNLQPPESWTRIIGKRKVVLVNSEFTVL